MGERRSFRTLIARAAFRHRGSAAAGFVVRQAFAHASRVLPVRRVAETMDVVAFHHPVPGFEPVHVLLVPRFSAPTLMHLTALQREQVSADVELLAGEVLNDLQLEPRGYSIIWDARARGAGGIVHLPAGPATTG